jgi:predicted RND superfamily exporter protein
MLRRLAVPLILVLALLIATAGLFRLRFDTDILSMLPSELPEVKGLKVFHEAFARNDELIVLIEGGEADAGALGDAAKSLGEHLQHDGVAKRARWQPLWMSEPAGLSELLAYLWLNGDPARVAAQAARLAPDRSQATVAASRAEIATAMEGMDMVMKSHDPFGFLNHPAIAALTSSGQGGEAFESPDGRSYLLFVDAPQAIDGYRSADEWLKKLKQSVATWQQKDGAGLKVGYTGEPAFSSEIGRAMETDLSGSIGITLGLIGLLFWWMQRRLSLLVGLIVVLGLVFVIALGVAGLMYGKLSIIALSSIEILIGLAVDYGLVICQEAKVTGHRTEPLREASGKPVLFGALTTAVVFLALNLGGFPGMAQLGSIVAIGLLAAAVLMLVVYLPFVAKFGVDRAPAVGSGNFLPRNKAAWLITGGLTVAAAVLLSVLGFPGVEFDSKIMRPKNSQAMDTIDRVQAAFPGWKGDSLGVVVEAKNDGEMQARLKEAHQRIEAMKQSGKVAAEKLPDGWWPDAAFQTANRPLLTAVVKDRERLLAEADAAGFSEEGIALGRTVLEAMERQLAENGTVFPKLESAKEVMRLFLSRRDDGGGYVLGSLDPAKGIEPAGKDYEAFRGMTGGGIWLSSWSLFKPAVAKLVNDDLLRMLVPMSVLLVGMMLLIFRRVGDVALALFAMAFSTLLLLAIMRLTGLKWNFVNLMATPLLLGTGIDYAIHVTLTLRRTGGCFQELWNGTSKALLFCGVSNVIGFGSLIFSSSEAMVSLGWVAVVGISLSMAVSIFLLPGWKHRAVTDAQ